MYIRIADTLRIEDLKVGDYVRSIYTGKTFKVKDIDIYWGHFQVTGIDGKTKNIRVNRGKSQTYVKLTPEEKADYLLKLETCGVTDYWLE
jgi:hypothetical protein